jgi:hypothetical protein
LNGPELKIQFSRKREATKGGLKAAPPLLRNNTWPDTALAPLKRRSTRGRETDVSSLIDILFSDPEGEDSDEADETDGQRASI